jgi:hypothetical protein
MQMECCGSIASKSSKLHRYVSLKNGRRLTNDVLNAGGGVEIQCASNDAALNVSLGSVSWPVLDKFDAPPAKYIPTASR